MRNELGVRTESTGWRDDWISDKHRSWGYDAPATDIDFLLVEYDHNIPKALIEHKTFGCRDQFGWDQIRRWHMPVSNLATLASIPSFVVLYDRDNSLFAVSATNDRARMIRGKDGMFGSDEIEMNERQYVSFLYYLRGRSVPTKVLEKIGGNK